MGEKFFLNAECSWEIGSDGKPLDYQMISVRVKDSEGQPVTGLKKSDFKVYDMGVFFGELKVQLVQELKSEAPSLPFLEGTYRLKLTRNIGTTGQFVYAVIVNKKARSKIERSAGTGQTLLSVVKRA
jgi:hypothetical protein